MNKILYSRYDELILEMSHNQTIEVLEREYYTQYIDDILEGKLEASDTTQKCYLLLSIRVFNYNITRWVRGRTTGNLKI